MISHRTHAAAPLSVPHAGTRAGGGAIDWACPHNVADAHAFLPPLAVDCSDFRDLMNSLCAALDAAHAYDDAWAAFHRGLDEESGPWR